MAAITADARQELVALYLTMFGRAPTRVQLAQMVVSRENGSTLAQVATTLALESDFAVIAAKDADSFATYVADALFATDIPASTRAWGIDWVVTQVQGTKTKAQIIAEAVQAIRATQNTNYSSSKAELAANVASALQAIDGFTLATAFEIGVDKLPANYNLINGDIDFGVNTIVELTEKILSVQEIIEKSANSKEIVLKYSYNLKDDFENLNKNSLIVDAASSYTIVDATVFLGDNLTVADYNDYSIAQRLNILNNADNKDSIELLYTIKDTLENISSTSFVGALNGASGYSLSNVTGNLGILTIEEVEILQGAKNYTDYTYIDLEDVESVNSILLSFGLTSAIAKSIILQHAESLDDIALALKKANLTAGEMAAILASSSGVDDPPIIIAENKIKKYFDGFVTDGRVTEGQTDRQGDNQDNSLLGTNAAEVFSGGLGEDSVIYDGEISRYKLTRLYDGKTGSFSGYSIQDLEGLGSIDKVNSDVEYIVFRDPKLKIPTSGTLFQGTAGGENIAGDSSNNILLGADGYDTFTGGDGVDTAIFMGNLIDHQLTKLYEGKNGVFSGYQISSGINGSDIAKISNDVEFIQFYDERIELASFLAGTVKPLSFEISLSEDHLEVEESAVLTFKFSEQITGFSIDDIEYSGGEISNLKGIGDTYYANFKNLGDSPKITIDIENASIRSNVGEVYISDGIKNIEAILDLIVNSQVANPILSGGAGNDVFIVSSPGIINGDSGFDQLWINDSRSNYTVSVVDAHATLTSKSKIDGMEKTFELESIERVHFSDKSLAFDMEGNGGIVASILYNIEGPEALDVPLFVGVGLGQLENYKIIPKELAELASQFFHGDDPFEAIFGIALNIHIYSGLSFFSTLNQAIFENIDFMYELAKPPSINRYASAELLGFKYLEYSPQYL